MHFPVLIGLHRSRMQGRLLGALVTFGLGFSLVLPLDVGVRLLLCLAHAALAGLAWRQWRRPLPVLRLGELGDLQLGVDGGADEAGIDGAAEGAGFVLVQRLPGAFAHPWLSGLVYADAKGRMHRLFIFPDSLTAEDFRRLRVWITWRGDKTAKACDP